MKTRKREITSAVEYRNHKIREFRSINLVGNADIEFVIYDDMARLIGKAPTLSASMDFVDCALNR